MDFVDVGRGSAEPAGGMRADAPARLGGWPGSLAGLVGLFSATLLVAAFLLFGLQPMFAKRVLPILGGTPAVWSVATVVFQALLLAGYAYAHLLTRRLAPRPALLLHALVLLAGFAFLPIAVASGFAVPPADAEAFWLVSLFLASVGLPFFALSASAPLLQAWFARSGEPGAEDPYFLYRASNAGSFAALLAYPLLVEPLLGLDAQARLWSLGYGALTCLVLACGLAVGHARPAPGRTLAQDRSDIVPARRLAWIGLAAVPSGLLVATTAHVSTDVAAIPLLWVVPLALYLLSFIVAFRPGAAWPERPLAVMQVVGTGFALAAVVLGPPSFLFDLGLSLALLFVNALIAHRAVYALRPGAARLTEFYLCTSLGGVLGGLFAALLAPILFSGIHEYPILLAAALACRPGLNAGGARTFAGELRLVLVVLVPGVLLGGLIAAGFGAKPGMSAFMACLLFGYGVSWRLPLRIALFGAALALAGILLPGLAEPDGGRVRSFFGLHRVYATEDGRFRMLVHGTTLHGAMRIRNDDGTPFLGRPEPTTYYAQGGALAEVLAISRQVDGPVPAVSVVGLGTGSLACHARPGEAWTYFEIDPAIIRIATDPRQFRFLSDCAPEARIVQGDARLTLARNRAAARVLIVDAFSSDAIPLHLLTIEGIDIALAHLDAKGLLALHISNRHFDLRHVLARVAAERGLTLLFRASAPTSAALSTRSHVVLLTRDPAVADAARAFGWSTVAPDPARKPWSDDYANVFEALIDRWRNPLLAQP